MMLVLGREPKSASIVEEHPSAGRVDVDPITDGYLGDKNDKSDEKRRRINIYLLETVAGSVAQDLFEPGRQRDSADFNDLGHARDFIGHHVGWTRLDYGGYFDRLLKRAREILEAHRDDIERVAAALRERKTITGDDLLNLCTPDASVDWEIPPAE